MTSDFTLRCPPNVAFRSPHGRRFSAAWLSVLLVTVAGCSSAETEPGTTGDPADCRAEVPLLTHGFAGPPLGWWFTSHTFGVDAGRLTGMGPGHAVLEGELHRPIITVDVDHTGDGTVVLGYLADGIRTGYDPERDPDPEADFRDDADGYFVALSGTTAVLYEGGGQGLVERARAEVSPGSARWRFEVADTDAPAAADAGELRISRDSEVLFAIPASADRQTGHFFVQLDADAAVSLDDLTAAAVGCAATLEPQGRLPFGGLTEVHRAAHDPEHLWITSTYATQGAWQSLDGGTTWQRRFVGLHTRSVVVLAPAAGDRGSRVLIGDKNGTIHISRNGGATWTTAFRTPSGVTEAGIMALVLASDAKTLTGLSLDGALLRSGDRGDTWTRYEGRFPAGARALVLLADGRALVGTASGLYQERSGGGEPSFDAVPTAAGVIMGLAVDPSDGQTVFAASLSGMYRSTDGAETFTALPIGPAGAALHAAFAASAPGTVYAAMASGLYRADDATTFERVGPERTFPAVHRVAVDPDDATRLFIGAPDLDWWDGLDQTLTAGPGPAAAFFRSDDGGATWTDVTAVADPDGFTVSSAPADRRRVLVGTMCSRGVYDSSDAGQSLRHYNGAFRYVLDVAHHPTDADRAWLTSVNGVFYSRDGGGQWAMAEGGAFFDGLAVSPDGVVYAGTTDDVGVGIDPEGNSITTPDLLGAVLLRSDDGEHFDVLHRLGEAGAGISALVARSDGSVIAGVASEESPGAAGVFRVDASGPTRLGFQADEGVVADLAVDPSEPSRLFVAGEAGIWRSDDDGLTWSLRAPWIAESLLVLPGHRVLAGTTSGVLDSRDGGDTFQLLAGGTAGGMVHDLAVRDADAGAVYAAVAGQGLMQLQLP